MKHKVVGPQNAKLHPAFIGLLPADQSPAITETRQKAMANPELTFVAHPELSATCIVHVVKETVHVVKVGGLLIG